MSTDPNLRDLHRDIYPSFLTHRNRHTGGEGCFCDPITTKIGSVTIIQHRNGPSEAQKGSERGKECKKS